MLHLAIIAGAIIYISICGALGSSLIIERRGWGSGVPPIVSEPQAFEARFARWDSGYYLTIARQGYAPDGAERAFFPLYPLLVALISRATAIPPLWVGWAISAACFAAGALLLFDWARLDHGSDVALWSLIWYCSFPVAFFMVAFYPEALFLLACIAALYFARRGMFLASGALIAVAGATRPVAFLLAVPYAVEFFAQRRYDRRRVLGAIAGALVAPLGTAAYLFHISALSGFANPINLYGANLERNWKMETVWPWVSLRTAFDAAIYGTGLLDTFSRLRAWNDLLALVVVVVVVALAARRMRFSSVALMLCGIVFYMTSQGTVGATYEGMPRHVASLVPLYVALALVSLRLPRGLRWAMVVGALLVLGAFSAWFVSGRWVA